MSTLPPVPSTKERASTYRRILSAKQPARFRSKHKALRVIHNLKYGRKKSRAYFKLMGAMHRAMLAKKYPLGKPMASRPGPWRMVVTTSDAAYVCKTSIRTAQRWFQAIRKEKGHRKNALVMLEDFCDFIQLPVDYVQEMLNRVPLGASFKMEEDGLRNKYKRNKEQELREFLEDYAKEMRKDNNDDDIADEQNSPNK